ncbi:hypothetical protein [Shewanella woodyi]|uniref:hypothetical protein n=1 Tax=Shewanella woodyi TaxID=60961 RepID=UPI003749AE26
MTAVLNDSTLDAYGIGDVPDWLIDEGLILAIEYFQQNALDPIECLEAHKEQNTNNNELTQHWLTAQAEANKVLIGHQKYNNSMICLEMT